MNAIIIAKDQGAFLPPLLNSLRVQLPTVNRLFVLDRCTDDSKAFLLSQHENFVENKEGTGFLAGFSRDLGLKTIGIENTLFLDGDRILNNFKISDLEFAIDIADICLIKVETDFRKNFTKTFIINPEFGKYHNDVFSCGFTIRKEMIEKVLKIQNNRLFHKNFDGNFGEEDRFLGDMIFHLGGTCWLFPENSYLSGDFSKVQDQYKYKLQRKIRYRLNKEYNIKIL
jgi:hypothetical protein